MKPSSGLSEKQKSGIAKKASAGKDIGKPGKNFGKVAAKAAKFPFMATTVMAMAIPAA